MVTDGEFVFVVVGGCLRFGRAWADSFGVGRVGCGLGCGEFWGVVWVLDGTGGVRGLAGWV